MAKSRFISESEISSITGEKSSHEIFQWGLLKVLYSIDSEYCDPVDGVVVIDEEYMRGRKVYGQLVTVYRYGREEDEVMGVKFSKEMILSKEQIFPMVNAKVKTKAWKSNQYNLKN